MDKKDIKSFSFDELNNEIVSMGEKSFRAKQIYDWLHVKLVRSFDEMTNLSNDLRSRLKENYNLTTLEIVRVQESKIDGTRKYLFKLPDGNLIESVWMIYKHGNSVCVSSQVGCRMGCKFCASTIDGLERNLNTSEILDQIYAITLDTKERVSNVVVMGSGEPMDNYDNTVKFVKMLSDEHGLNISQRNITVSTCGIVPKIYDLADEDLSITLAISLHATTDEKRRNLMPIANKYSIKEIKEACLNYFDKTGRRICFEYALISGFNDTDACIEELAKVLKGRSCHVNLIPLNSVKEKNLMGSTRKRGYYLAEKLEKLGISATVRRTMGEDIEGACGQLRNRIKKDG